MEDEGRMWAKGRKKEEGQRLFGSRLVPLVTKAWPAISSPACACPLRLPQSVLSRYSVRAISGFGQTGTGHDQVLTMLAAWGRYVDPVRHRIPDRAFLTHLEHANTIDMITN